MRLGKEVLEADLYRELGVLPDATESEIRACYRARALASHPDLNPADPEAPARMARLNVAARVLLDPALRRIYDLAQRGGDRGATANPPAPRPEWFEQRERSADDDWSAPAAVPAPQSFWAELRGRDGQLGLRIQELVQSLSARQQLGVAALLFAVALSLVAMAGPRGVVGDAPQPTSVHVGSVYP